MLRRTALILTATLGLAALIALPEPLQRAERLPSANSAYPATATLDRGPNALNAALETALRGSARICKPGGPWGAHLEARGASSLDAVNFDVVLKPLLAHSGLQWELALPVGTQLLSGVTSGEIHGEPGEETRVALSVRLPADLQFGSLRLDVTPLHAPALHSSRELDFGAAPQVGDAQLFIADSGAESALIVLSSSTREGR